MNSFENFQSSEISENTSAVTKEFPKIHFENMDTSYLEKLTPDERAFVIGKNLFIDDIKDSAGVYEPFRDLTGKESAEDFAKCYADYVNHPEKMMTEQPELYNFMRDRIFYGREYAAEEEVLTSGDTLSFGNKCNSLDIIATSPSEHISFGSSLEDVEKWQKKIELQSNTVHDKELRVKSEESNVHSREIRVGECGRTYENRVELLEDAIKSGKNSDTITRLRSDVKSAENMYKNAVSELNWAKNALNNAINDLKYEQKRLQECKRELDWAKANLEDKNH